MSSPVPFIQQVDDKFQVMPEAIEILLKVRGKVSIVCVAGPYRTGKSFLLNRLIGRQNGFKVGATVKACTKGIWLWGEPIQKDDITYIFMDSEGLGSMDQSVTFDTQIFSLAVLLSSFFILNTQGTINEQALEQLDLVVQCSKQIRIHENKESQEGELADHFPNFLWVLRDFVLQLMGDDEQPITSKQYLEDCLRHQKAGRGSKEKNRIRDAVKAVFSRRDCVTLVRPVLDEAELQNLSKLPFKTLRKEFRTQMEALCDKVYSGAKPKQMNGAFVNGSALVGLAQAYTEAMNTGAVPTIQTAWQAVVTSQSHEALEAAVKLFEERVAEVFKHNKPVSSETLQEEFDGIERAAVSLLKERSVGDESHIGRLEDSLREKLSAIKKSRVAMNDLKSKDWCQDLMERLWDQAGLDRQLDQYTREEQMESEWGKVLTDYDKQALGPRKIEVRRAFLEKKLRLVLRGLFGKSSTLAEELDAVKKAKKAAEDKAAKEQSKLETRLEQQLAATQAQIQRVEELQAQLHQAQQEHTNKVEQLKEKHSNTIDKLQSKLQESINAHHAAELKSQQELHKTTQELEARAQKAESKSQASLSELKQSQKDVASLETKVDNLQKEKDEQNKELQSTDKLRAQAEQKAQKLERDLEKLQDKNQRLSDEVDTLGTENKVLKESEKDMTKKLSQGQKKTQQELQENILEIARLSKELAQANKRLEENQAASEQLRGDQGEIISQLQMDLKKAHKDAEKKLKAWEAECRELKEQVEALKNERDTAESEKENLATEIQHLVSERDNLLKQREASPKATSQVKKAETATTPAPRRQSTAGTPSVAAAPASSANKRRPSSLVGGLMSGLIGGFMSSSRKVAFPYSHYIFHFA